MLGVLGAEDTHAVSEHLATGCPQCRAQVREATLTIYLLAHTGRTMRPHPKSKASLLRRLHAR